MWILERKIKPSVNMFLNACFSTLTFYDNANTHNFLPLNGLLLDVYQHIFLYLKM